MKMNSMINFQGNRSSHFEKMSESMSEADNELEEIPDPEAKRFRLNPHLKRKTGTIKHYKLGQIVGQAR